MNKLALSKGACVWITGLPASGKSTVLEALHRQLDAYGIRHTALDSEKMRAALWPELGFSLEERKENSLRLACIAAEVVKFDGLALVACVSPLVEQRTRARRTIEHLGEFVEVLVDTPLSICKQRDPKGLYKKALAGEIDNFTGVQIEYETSTTSAPAIKLGPEMRPDVIIDALIGMNVLHRKLPRALYIGRFQPFHQGHHYIINESLNAGKPVAIGVRDMPPSENNPIPLVDRIHTIRQYFKGREVVVFPVPDIESINYGRDVGYDIIKIDAPEEIEAISATKIRERAGNV